MLCNTEQSGLVFSCILLQYILAQEPFTFKELDKGETYGSDSSESALCITGGELSTKWLAKGSSSVIWCVSGVTSCITFGCVTPSFAVFFSVTSSGIPFFGVTFSSVGSCCDTPFSSVTSRLALSRPSSWGVTFACALSSGVTSPESRFSDVAVSGAFFCFASLKGSDIEALSIRSDFLLLSADSGEFCPEISFCSSLLRGGFPVL